MVKRGVLAACLLLMFASAAQAATCTSCTWTGAGATANWSNGSNWVGGNAPDNPLTSLSFPPLGGCSGTTCYTSNNDIGAIATTTLSIDDGSPYAISGNGIVVGGGGLQAAPTGAVSAVPTISAPVSLNAPQTWSINGGGGATPGGLLLTQDVSAAGAEQLNINLSNQGLLVLEGGADVGPVAVSGTGTVGLGTGASLNGATGQPVSFGSGTSLTVFGGSSSVGPLTLNSAALQIGSGGTAAQLSDLSGGTNSFDSGSTLTLAVARAGNQAGTDYSQFRAGGPINLGGGTLHLTAPSPCPTLNVGDVLSLVATTATISGTFSNAPNGSMLPLTCSGGTAATLQIAYTASAVTATVVSGTSTSLTASPTSAVTNQPVTLTAKVTPGYGSAAPQGTVEFDNHGSAIAGCASVPVNSSGTATCVPTFSATSSPEGLTARFTPSSGSGFSSSATASSTSLSVGKAPASIVVSTSRTSPGTDEDVTYTAVVTPAYSGAALLTGDVQFFDNGAPITDCSDQTQSTDSSGMTVTCTTSYSSTGTHRISASYPGDANFTRSSSASRTVNVQGQSGNGNGNGGGGGNGGNTKGKLKLPGRTLKVKHGHVSFTLQCASKKACAGRFAIVAKKLGRKPKLVVCASARYRIKAGGSKRITAKVSAVCLSGLRHAHGHRIEARFSAKPKTGQGAVGKNIVLTL